VVPSGSTVKVCSSPVAELSARLMRILPLVPPGLADAGAVLTAATATTANTPHKNVVSRRISPPLVVRGAPPPATSPGPVSERCRSLLRVTSGTSLLRSGELCKGAGRSDTACRRRSPLPD
jgi:hypothetical protein